MRSLEIAATAVVASSSVPFLAAWDIPGEAGRKYREAVERAAYYGMALLVVPAGAFCGFLVALVAPLDPRPANSFKGLRAYRYRRNYHGRHHSGLGVQEILNAVAG